MMSALSSRHTCLVYDGPPAEHLPVVAPLIADGLREGYRCLYLNDPASVQLASEELERRGVDVAGLVRRGALLLSSERAHLDGGGFEPEPMLKGLEKLIDQAVADGYAGLCATGDMAWELGDGADLTRLLGYEMGLEALFHRKPLRGICQYRRGSVPARALEDALRTHPRVIVGRGMSRQNTLFVPPELQDLRADAARDARGEWLWRQLDRSVEAERERDEALQQLTQTAEELERRVAERTAELRSFTYAAAHDLKAPLRSINGFSSIIERRYAEALPAEARELFGHVREGAQRMERLLDALLALAKLGDVDLRLEDVDLSSLAESSVTRLKNAEPQRRVEAVIQPGLRASGDSRLLSTLIDNLLGNAWKFSSRRPEARVEFGAWESGGRRAFFVRDNGAGFAKNQLQRLFQPFQRLHSQSEFAGNGLGLTIVKRIVARHDGEVWAESEAGQGATFYFTLPDAPRAQTPDLGR